MIDLIKFQVLTEKTNLKLNKNIYTFDVDKRLNKNDIKIIIKDVFNVKVISINSYVLPGRISKLGKYLGFKSFYKRVFIRLEKGDIIGFFSGL
jgi:large subunit ribosomal protein L23